MKRHAGASLREVVVMTALALGALVAMRLAGVISPVPITVLVGVVVFAMTVTSVASYWEVSQRVVPLGLRVGAQMVATSLVIYVTGWGPVLSVGYVFCAAQSVALEGSPAVWPATLWSLACLAVAEVGVGLGWVPSVVSRGYSHGIAVLMAAGLVFVMRIVWVSASERERAARSLAKSEDRLRRLLANAADAVVVLDPSGTIVFATEAIETLTGYGVGELVGRRDAGVIVQPDDLARIRAALAGAVVKDPGAPFRADMRVHHRDGSLRWCQITVTNRVDDPAIEGVVVNVHDITDRREAQERVAVAEARFRSLVQHAADGILVLNRDGGCVYVSPSYERVTGYGPVALSEHRLRDLCHPDDVSSVSAAWSRLLRDPAATQQVEVRVRHADGRWHWQAISLSNRLDDPTIGGMILNVRDVTDRKATEVTLAEESAILEMIAWDEQLEPVLDRVASLTATSTGARYCLVRVVEGGTLRLAAAPDLPQNLFEQFALVPLDDDATSARAAAVRQEVFVADAATVFSTASIIERAASLGVVATWSVPIELPNRSTVAGTLTMLFPTSDVARDAHRPLVERMVSLAAVAIEQARARQELEYRAFHDELTGLPNRALLNDRLTHALQRGERQNVAVAVLFLDLDRFKLVNDSLGHDAGDRLLVQVAQRFRAKLRPADTVARLGGDEFVILVEDVHDDDQVQRAARRLVEILQPPFDVDGETIFVSASIGVSVARGPHHAPDVLREADDAMYRAKQHGRATIEYQTTADTPPAATRLARITALHGALDRDELVVYYQPIVDIASRQPVGAEALVRWNHPELGLILPGEFIPLAEDTGLIVPIGWHVIEHAIRRIQHCPHLPVSVNVSARQLSEDDFITRLRQLVAHIPPAALTLEITETMLIDQAERVAETLTNVDRLGVRLALDDFGTGYSSLSYLSTLPIHQLKIDRAFIAGLGERPEYETLISGIIHLSRGLGLAVIAEGVETQQQAEALRHLGCRLAQGYHFGHPQRWSRPNPAAQQHPTSRNEPRSKRKLPASPMAESTVIAINT